MNRRVIERRRRGPIGNFVRALSWLINLGLAWCVFLTFGGRSDEISPELAGADPTGAGILLLIGWGMMAIVLALVNLPFRGRREFVEVDGDNDQK